MESFPQAAEAVSGFVGRHKEGIGLFALAAIATMRPALPAPFDRFPLLVWLWAWLHDALNTLINLRTPAPVRPAGTVEATATTTTSVTRSTTDTASITPTKERK